MAIVRFRRDEIPPSTPEEEAHYRALMERPDREITDPENPEVFDFSNWMTVEEFELYRTAKKRLRALNDLPDREIDDPEMPEITDISGWLTVDELEAYLAAKKNQAATV